MRRSRVRFPEAAPVKPQAGQGRFGGKPFAAAPETVRSALTLSVLAAGTDASARDAHGADSHAVSGSVAAAPGRRGWQCPPGGFGSCC
jgi:hypothetical protein